MSVQRSTQPVTASATRVATAGASAAAAGAGLLSILNIVDWAQRGGQAGPSLQEAIGLGIASSIFRLAYPIVRNYSLPFLIVVSIFAGCVIWKSTRRTATAILHAGIGLTIAGLAALVCALTYLSNPTVGLLLPIIAVVPAMLISHCSRAPISVWMIVAIGFGVGTFGAQLTSAPGESVSSPLYGFIPPVVIAILLAWKSAPFVSTTTGRGSRLAQCWGLCATCMCATFLVGAETYVLRARPVESPAIRVLNDWTYDLYVPSSTSDLLWTTRVRTSVLSNAYGDAHEPSVLGDDHAMMGERIWRADNGDFYLQANSAFGWWHLTEGVAIPREPTAWIPKNGWYGPGSTTTSTFAEDPATGRLLVMNEWQSRYAVVERDTTEVLATGTLSDGVWPWWYATVDAAARVAFISSAFDDGGLYELNFDTLRVTRSAPNFYMYETVLDADAGILWGVRPVSGEILGVDTGTLEARWRIPVAMGLRDVQFDRQTGDLFTASVFTGDIYRIDRQTLTPSRIGWCGRLARNLYLDTRHRTLWIATADGVCRLPIATR